MSIINSQPLIGASGQSTGYTIAKSLRFRGSASAYLNRTPASAGNRQKWTWSAWVKRGALGGSQDLFSATIASPTGDTDVNAIRFDTNNNLFFGGGATTFLITSQVFRDPAAWYHIVVAFDSTQATASNRIKMYVNGVQVTAFLTANYVTQNLNGAINNTIQHDIGSLQPLTGNYFDGYITEVNFINDQQLTPASFGESDATTGVWKPKRYTGTYGTNGFYLPFTDVATTSGSNAGLGKDFSGNGNYWTTNNISVTSGSTYDSMTDVPTLTSATAANYAVLNPLQSTTSPTNANLTLSGVSAGTWYASVGAIGMSNGKYYFEVSVQALSGAQSCHIGIVKENYVVPTGTYIGNTATSYGYRQDGTVYNNNSGTAYGASFAGGDLIGVALDLDNGTLVFYKNGASQGTAASGLSGIYFFAFSVNNGSGATVIGNANFGQRPFAYTPPTGFKALNTYNLPDSTIVAGNKVFDATTYTGNGTGQSIVNAGAFKPDLVWVKIRNQAYQHYLVNSIAGPTKFLTTNGTTVETTYTLGLTSFNSNGFSIGADTGAVNESGSPLVAWQWQAGQGTTSTNTSGSITSTVSVNASAGFSIVTYNGNATNNASIGHGLGVAPKFIVIKSRTSNQDWGGWTTAIPGSFNFFSINTTGSLGSNITSVNQPNSSVFYLSNSTLDNSNGQSFVAYCWAEVAGFSKFGSYTGNGSAAGPFIYTGFKPAFIMIKCTSTTEKWYMGDSKRPTYNGSPGSTGVQGGLSANVADAEFNNGWYQFYSNGFSMNFPGAETNGSGRTYIYMAFAENPFKNSLAR